MSNFMWKPSAEAIEVAARTRMGDVMVHVSSRGRFEWRESYLDMSVSDYHKVWEASTVTL